MTWVARWSGQLDDRTLANLRKISANIFKPRSVLRLLRRVGRNVLWDLRYGGFLGFLGGRIKSRYGHLGAHEVGNTDYGAMPYLFGSLSIAEEDVLVDVGCGKGRVINWWLARGFKNKLIGIEIDEEVAAKTKRRLSKHKNVEIIAGNVLDLPALEGTIYYLANPFCGEVLRVFKDRVAAQAKRSVRIVYFNPVYTDVFRQDPRWKVTPIVLPLSVFFSDAEAVLFELVRNQAAPEGPVAKPEG